MMSSAPSQEREKLVRELRELRLVRELRVRHAVHALRPLVDLSLRIEVAVERGAGEPAVHELECRSLDHAMTRFRIKPRRLGV